MKQHISNAIFMFLNFFFAFVTISSIRENYPIVAYIIGIIYMITAYSFFYNMVKEKN